MSDQTTVAYHEAAHAVMAEAFGVRVRRVTIEPAEDYVGRCWFDRRCKRGALVRALIYMAGSSSEQLWKGRAHSNVASSDYDLVVECGFRGRDVGALQDVSRILVRQRRPAIARVARALLKHKTLTGKEVRALL